MGYLNDKHIPNTEFGNTARDNILQYQLDNEVAATIISVAASETAGDDNMINIVLKNKKGDEIARTGNIVISPNGNKIVKSLTWVTSEAGTKGKCLRLTFKGKESEEDTGYIDLSFDDFYNRFTTIETNKQDKLYSSGTGQNIKTVGGNDLLGQGDIAFPATGVTKVIVGEGLTGGTITSEGTIATDFTIVGKAADIKTNANAIKTKQEKLNSGTNIKTINNESILGPGNIVVGGDASIYKEYQTISLDDTALQESGVFAITSATGNPEHTAVKGTLDVRKLTCETGRRVKQTWLSDTNIAYRILDPDRKLHFSVNEIEQTQGDIVLAAGGTYVLKGDLRGSIIIGSGSTETNVRTKIILDGVNIQTTTQYAAINYSDEASKLIVEINYNTENYLVVNRDEPKEDDDLGCLNSNNNIVVQGIGYLTIINKKGHGIKASELIINGDPHIYVTSKHDAIHGGKMLKITGGHIKVMDCNDAFSCKGSTDNGKMLIYGGNIEVVKTAQAAFDGKSSKADGYKRLIGAKIILDPDVTIPFSAPATSPFKIYNGLNEIINNSGKAIPDFVDLAAEYPAPSITDPDGNPIDCSGALITIENNTHKALYTLKGNFSGKKIVFVQGSGAGTNLDITNLYYYNNDSFDEDTFIKVEHAAGVIEANKKRLKIKLASEFSTSFVYKKAGYCFNVDKNIQFTSKGDLFVQCELGTAINAPKGYVLLAGDGLRSIRKSKIGVYANSIKLGEDPDDVAEYSQGEASCSDDAIYILNSTTADIKISKEGDPVYTSQILATQYHAGISVLGNSIQDTGAAGTIIALAGTVHQKEGADYQNTALLYAKESELAQNENVINYEEISGFKPDIPELLPPVEWKVYQYEQSAKLAEFEARISALEHGTGGLNPVLDNTGNLTLSNTSISDAGEVDLKASTIDENGNVTLK